MIEDGEMVGEEDDACDEKRFDEAMNIAARVLSRRIHSVRELETKLLGKGVSKSLIPAVIAKCERLGYVNDELAARIYFDHFRSKGYGSRYVSLLMKRKGIAGELTETLISEHESETDEIGIARQAYRKKQKSFEREKDSRKRKEKIWRFLYSRGFSQDVISEIIRENE